MSSTVDAAYDQELDDDFPYRALSSTAAVSLALGLLSVLAILDWTLALVPMAGIALGVWAIVSIRRNPDMLTGASLARAGVVLSVVFWAGGWSWLGYVYATEVPPGYERTSFSALQTPKEAMNVPPPEVREMEGKKVFIKGYIRPNSHDDRTNTFLLVRDDGACCFGDSMPVPGDMMRVTMSGAVTDDFRLRLRRVGGTLRIKWVPYQATGYLYHLDADYIQ